MPHKRAKRSAREQVKKQSGSDLAPVSHVISKEPVPKSVSRVLDAVRIQEEYRAKKRKPDGEPSDQSKEGAKKKRKTGASVDGGAESMKIQPGESLGHFNRRVENSLRGTVRDAMQTSAAHARKAKKEGEDSKKSKSGSSSSLKPPKLDPNVVDTIQTKGKPERNGPTEFTSLKSSAPRRLNDVVRAPPEFTKLPRGVKSKQPSVRSAGALQAGNLRDGMLTMARKAMLEEERERAVRLYREMKQQNFSSES